MNTGLKVVRQGIPLCDFLAVILDKVGTNIRARNDKIFHGVQQAPLENVIGARAL
jgi:hypothetical protein